MKGIDLLKYHDTGIDTLSEKKHYHDHDLEILHILSGEGTMMIKNKLYPISPNTIFFIRGKDAHFSAPNNPATYTRNKIIFSEELIFSALEKLGCQETISSLFGESGNVVKLSSDLSLRIDKYFLKLSELTKNNTVSLNFFINLFSILATAEKSKGKTVSEVKNKISEVIDHINDNLDKKLSLDVIATETKISKYYLCHSFSSVVGMTVMDYLTLARISKAKQLLSETSLSISDIATEVGFDSFAYFSKVFREKESVTPRAYRAKHREIYPE